MGSPTIANVFGPGVGANGGACRLQVDPEYPVVFAVDPTLAYRA